MGVRTRKTALGLLMLVLAFSMVASACSKSNNGGASESPKASTGTSEASPDANSTEKVDPFTISIFLNSVGPIPTEDNKIYQEIKDQLGITLKEEYLVGDIEQKLGVMIAGGDYPDMITAHTKLTAAKAVIPLEDLIEQHAPNLKKHFANVWEQLKDPADGHIYWLPGYGVYQGDFKPTDYMGPAFYIQKAVLKEFGYPTPKTLDEYFKLIEDYAAKYPEIDGQPTIGYTSLAFDWRDWGLRNAPQHLAGHPNDGGVLVDPNTNVATLYSANDISKPYYKKLNEINAKGLMDKEAFAQNYDQFLAKISSGRVLGMFEQRWNFGQAHDSLVSQGKYDRTYVGFPLVYDTNTKDHYLDRPPLNLGTGFGITINAEEPEKIIKFLDTMLSEKWQKRLNWGEEGVDYLVGDNGLYYRTPEMRKQQDDVTWKQKYKAESLWGNMPKLEGNYPDGNADGPGNQPDEFFANLKDIDREVLTAYGFKTWSDFFSTPPENRVSYPAWNIDLIEGSPAKVANQKMKDLDFKLLPKAILSKPEKFEEVWSDYVAQMGKVDTQAYLDRVNEMLKWRVDNWTSK
ncbi:ABC transporter substrate-binding protein [Paenibacillus sp. NEAU-GSW1]|uniref:ABC transporter substrate-binding protein n=1 Tax=Paenibacillus sp. NEAU-GSW1 TaxID=2682486 RepID=UPI0012E25CAF|nr:ABC transporter substrate-binding protein [Paenibacillus sp. NEAU-GSW1]MUT64696.1 extracellular solute-binding protein [Paenibacillus sp. NEAU-GSW1]